MMGSISLVKSLEIVWTFVGLSGLESADFSDFGSNGKTALNSLYLERLMKQLLWYLSIPAFMLAVAASPTTALGFQESEEEDNQPKLGNF